MTPGAASGITLETAERMLAAARRHALDRGWKVAISIVDAGAHLVAFQRMDGAQIGSIDVSLGKAQTAVRFMRPTLQLEELVSRGRTGFLNVAGVLPLQGGLPVTIEGVVAGGVGVSGATGAEDEEVAAAALAAIDAAGGGAGPRS